MRVCDIPDCGGKHKGHGYCYKHLMRVRKYGDPHILKMRPDGTGKIRKDGYIDHKIGGKMYLEHRLIWEAEHGPIPDGYVIHHKDHNRANNKLENLELMEARTHTSHHWTKRRRRATTCCIVGCARATEKRPLCWTHWTRLRNHGSFADPKYSRKCRQSSH